MYYTYSCVARFCLVWRPGVGVSGLAVVAPARAAPSPLLAVMPWLVVVVTVLVRLNWARKLPDY